MKPLESIAQNADTFTAADLLEGFCDYACSNAIVMFARLVCSCYLQQQADVFAPFLEADGYTVSSPCPCCSRNVYLGFIRSRV